MSKEVENIRAKLINWTVENKHLLPINSIFWDVLVVPKSNKEHLQKKWIEFGKYNARMERGIPFYKPYSKLFDK